MDEQKAQTDPLNGAADAGHKMASANPDAATSATHELKIMDVEGAVVTEPPVEPMVILVDDDEQGDEMVQEEHEDADLLDINMDEGSTPLVAELQSALSNLDEKPSGEDPLLGDPDRDMDTLSAKTEPSSDAESNPSYHDPMGLLERLETQEADSQDEDEDYSIDDCSSSANGGITRRKMPRAKRWLIWMKRWPWMLHEDSDGTYAFCLYCNMSINVNNRAKHIQQHNMSLYHQERENNYLAFKKSEEQTRGATSDNEVKHEFGTKSYVAAMKKKRISEIEAFNNFNWLRWLRWHPWLERSQAQGTIGLCRVCNIKMNVEFVYLRKRHETTKGHQEALRQQDSDKPSRKRKRSKSTSGPSLVDEEADQETEPQQEEEPEAEDTTVVTINGHLSNNEDPGQWFELIPDTSPQQCRCTLCNCPMAITSFMRHCKTHAHCQKLTDPARRRSTTERGIWAVYADLHPWMIADPEEPNLAYCKVCQKRFMYGNSEIKRKNHEKSEKHTLALAAAKVAGEAGIADGERKEDGSDEEEEEEQAEAEASEPSQSEARSGSEGSEEDDDNWSDKQKGNKGLAAKSVAEPRRAKVRAGKRFYPWLCFTKDRKTQLCKYCRVRFHSESAKARHDFSARHQKLMNQFKARQAKLPQNKAAEEEDEVDEDGQSNSDSGTVDNKKRDTRPIDKLFVKPIPATMKGKVMVWKSRFPWLTYKKNEMRVNYAWCKLCDVSIFLPSSKWAAKHQRTSRHIRLRNERKRNGGQPPRSTESISAAVATAAALASGEARQKAAMAELQSKYDWLEPDANDENHCHCRVCDTRLPIKVFFLRQHDASRKHADGLERQRSNNAKDAAPSVSTHSEATADAEVQESGLEVDKDSDADMSVRSDGSTAEPPAKRSRRSMEVRRILRALRDSMGKRLEERSQLDMAKDMICSSFDIVTRLRTMEREGAMGHGNCTAQAPEPARATLPNTQPSEPRHVMDLFFDSIAPTMKSLPADLAAEGKAKIMQLVCGLEVRAMHRNSAKAASPVSSPPSSTPATAAAESASAAASVQATAADIDFHSNVITINDDDQVMQNNNNDVDSTPNKSASGAPTASLTINGSPKDLPVNIRRILSSSQLQVTNRNDPDSVRCVPLDKLTTQSPISVNGNGRHSQGGSLEAPPTPGSEVKNGNTLAMLRQIRVNNNNSSKMITISKAPMQSPQQQNSGSMSSPMVRGAPNSIASFRPMLNHNRRP
ncbi:protein suppressor of variegation 3-7 isoform X1 [Drosophila kikkawai]|uniref:Protein suppressor of variegation 3-7 isoform X1 n=1 Tax=Drosophila kikkawai TaxID=30033 RepID=A0A6P4IFX3_DROKI|nr:protein suppressor of variegation 3-7-like isoform X1 [Drosophila kikkawai]